MLIAFPGKRVVVAGAARGIGRAIAVEFARLGADVHACDILVDEVRAYADEFDGEGMIRPVWVDVTDPRSVAGVIEAAEAGTGAVDVLVYVAGGVRGQAPLPVDEVEPDDFRRHRRGEPHRRLPLRPRRRAGHEAGRPRPHRHDLEPRRPGDQPHRHPEPTPPPSTARSGW